MNENNNLILPKKISLKNHPNLNEAWLQDIIANNTEILGLGDVIVKDKERTQPSGGRLDLLLQDVDSLKRYEMEIQLGKTDESHIIRTIEYWDIERKRYPQYEHCAVIVAEDITSRFLNVISLFNGYIPLIALKVSAYEYDGKYFIVFNKILDEVRLGLIDEDEEVKEVTDRNYWLDRGTNKTVSIVDEALKLIKEINSNYELKYNKFYIGLANKGVADNFVIFRPQKIIARMEIRLEKSQETEEYIEEKGLELLDYDSRNRTYRINLKSGNVEKHKETLTFLFKKSMGMTDEEG
ncbi:MAG: hypothetical protein EWM50_04440 [Gottschalkiaceae bacterium]|nr:MAG: hypothetical protein EWM50_04440 [Gottschalkiaceae bacterium]